MSCQTTLTMDIKNGKPIVFLKRITGHSSFAQLNRYYQHNPRLGRPSRIRRFTRSSAAMNVERLGSETKLGVSLELASVVTGLIGTSHLQVTCQTPIHMMIDKFKVSDIKRIQHWINNYLPKKVCGYKSANEV